MILLLKKAMLSSMNSVYNIVVPPYITINRISIFSDMYYKH